MKIKRIISVFLIFAVFIPCFASCSYLERLRPKKAEITTYTNSDYHFTLTYPSRFSEIKEIPSEENGDEYRIELRRNDTDMIVVDIKYKTASNLYEFAEISGFDKSKITPLSMSVFPNAINSFSYDLRQCAPYEKPSYYIYASTKRMLYTVSYTYDKNDENGPAVCDTLAFEFDIYANVPKESQLMSPLYYFAAGYVSVSVPADNTVNFYPNPDHAPAVVADPETGEITKPMYTAYNRITAKSDYSYFALDVPETTSVSLNDLSGDSFDDNMAAILSELAGADITNAKLNAKGTFSRERMVNYRKLYFTCYYNGKPASGTIMVGYTAMLKYFRNVYIVSDDATAAQRVNYESTLKSLKI